MFFAIATNATFFTILKVFMNGFHKLKIPLSTDQPLVEKKLSDII